MLKILSTDNDADTADDDAGAMTIVLRISSRRTKKK